MSTACEAMVLRHMDVRVLGISCITNIATLDAGNPTTNEEVQEVAGQASEAFVALVEETVVRIAAA